MLFVQILLIGWVEGKRWADLKNPGSQGDGSFLGVTDELKGQSNGCVRPAKNHVFLAHLSKTPAMNEIDCLCQRIQSFALM